MSKITYIQKNILLLSILILFSIILLNTNFISAVDCGAACTNRVNVTILVNHITNDGLLNAKTAQKYVVNISVRAPAENNFTRATAYIQGLGSTANTTLFNINITEGIANVTSSNSGVTYNISISINASFGLEDGNDYNLTIVLLNVSDRFNVSRLVTIDHGIPPAATLLLPTSDFDNDDLATNFSATVTSANTTSCAINFTSTNPGRASYNGVYSGTSCSVRITNIPDNDYVWVVTTSDGTNTTRSVAITTPVFTSRSTTLPKVQVKQIITEKSRLSILNKGVFGVPFSFLIALIILIIVLFAMGLTGKRRR